MEARTKIIACNKGLYTEIGVENTGRNGPAEVGRGDIVNKLYRLSLIYHIFCATLYANFEKNGLELIYPEL